MKVIWSSIFSLIKKTKFLTLTFMMYSCSDSSSEDLITEYIQLIMKLRVIHTILCPKIQANYLIFMATSNSLSHGHLQNLHVYAK